MSTEYKPFFQALRERYTCKRYDPKKVVRDADFAEILEAGRLSPSSFGMEPWRFLVIENPEVKARVFECAWGAKKGAAKTVVILARKNLTADTTYFNHVLADVKQMADNDRDQYAERFTEFQTTYFGLDTEEKLFAWASRQCYIALGNMLSAAAVLGIDATPVEGFNLAALENYLVSIDAFDPAEYGVAVLVQFGYASADHMALPNHKLRRTIDEVVAQI